VNDGRSVDGKLLAAESAENGQRTQRKTTSEGPAFLSDLLLFSAFSGVKSF